MKTTDLKMTKKERKEYYGVMPSTSEGPQYPYDTTITICRDHLEDLGFTAETLPKSGTEITIEATGYIKRTQVESREKDEDSMEVVIQITNIGFEPTKKQKKADKKSSLLSDIS